MEDFIDMAKKKNCMLIKVIVAIFFFVEICRRKNGIKFAALKRRF
jgi:hypothetical protein